MRRNSEKGAALIITLFVMITLVSLSSLFILRTVHENRMAKMERDIAKSFYASQGSAQVALESLDNLINNFLLNTITNAAPSGVVSSVNSYYSSGDGIGWLLFSVRDDNVPVLAQNGEQAEYTRSGLLNNFNYQYTIIITEKSDPLLVTANVWDFPFNYRIESSVPSNGITDNIVLTGDFTVRIRKDNFAKYALFTSSQTTQSGNNVWFTNKTNFDGPVHTNERFNFALNPSGTFYGTIDQVESTARFYNNGSPVLLDADFNGADDVPVFNSGFNREVTSVALSSSSQKQDMIDEASASQSYAADGIYTPNNGTSLTGGIFVKGDSTINMTVDAGNNAVYTITQGSTTKIITVNKTAQQVTINDIAAGTTQTYSGLPDGISDVGTLIYVDGNINSLQGTVQPETELTISSNNDIIISGNIQYTNYTPAVGNPGESGYVPPNAIDQTNLLGLVSWEGNVRIGTSAPDNINIHGTILARNGMLQVDNYNNRGVGPRGEATLLGGVITDNYGAFGLFSGSTGQQLSGYGRNFVYDQRMLTGNTPPYFPSLSTFIAFSNDITDKIIWQVGDN